MTKHTPGPWTSEPAYNNRVHREIRTPGCLIAIVGNLGDTSDHAPTRARWKAETVANARLIALAPEMFEYIASSASAGCATARALIAKAEAPTPAEDAA